MVFTENFDCIIYFVLKSKLPKNIKLKIILFETDKNSVEVEQ